MAITRQANVYRVIVQNDHKVITGGKLYKNANKVIIDALDGNINLNSNKKVINNGGA